MHKTHKIIRNKTVCILTNEFLAPNHEISLSKKNPQSLALINNIGLIANEDCIKDLYTKLGRKGA